MKVGIDYGTTTTLVSYTEKGGPRSRSKLIDIGGDRPGYMRSSIPSTVAIAKNGKYHYGYDAENMASKNPNDVVLLKSLKRCLGCMRQTSQGIKHCWNPMNFSFCLGGQKLRVFHQIISVRDLVKTFIAETLKNPVVQQAWGRDKFDSVGISVPAGFGSEPRHTVYGLMLDILDDRTNIDVVNEPTAAVIACHKEMLKDEDGIYAMLDVGGGTSDIVVYEKKRNNYFLFKPSGLRVAGDDIDNELMKRLWEGAQKSKISEAKAIMEVRRAKERLTESKQATVLGHRLSRKDFEKIAEPILLKIVEALQKEIKTVFDDYKPYSRTGQKFKMRRIYLSGGGAKIPFLADLIKKDKKLQALGVEVGFVRNKELDRIYRDDIPIVVVALGASMPKKGITDSIQYMLPYAIQVQVGDKLEKIVPIYKELPVKFSIHNTQGARIQMFAVDSLNKSNRIVHDLTKDLESSEDDRMPLAKFLTQANHFEVRINKNNIMRVIATSPGYPIRPFQLPWQGGIESALFEKYRRKWRKQKGYI